MANNNDATWSSMSLLQPFHHALCTAHAGWATATDEQQQLVKNIWERIPLMSVMDASEATHSYFNTTRTEPYAEWFKDLRFPEDEWLILMEAPATILTHDQGSISWIQGGLTKAWGLMVGNIVHDNPIFQEYAARLLEEYTTDPGISHQAMRLLETEVQGGAAIYTATLLLPGTGHEVLPPVWNWIIPLSSHGSLIPIPNVNDAIMLEFPQPGSPAEAQCLKSDQAAQALYDQMRVSYLNPALHALHLLNTPNYELQAIRPSDEARSQTQWHRVSTIQSI